jgi:CreA protein
VRLNIARATPHEGFPEGCFLPVRIFTFVLWSLPMSSSSTRLTAATLLTVVLAWLAATPVAAADEPDLIFRRSTVFKLLSPDDKLATYGLDDPEVEGVACHFTVPERGGYKGWLGLAEEVSDISLACRQIAPIRFKNKMSQGEDMFRQRRSLFFKKMQIVRGCDAKRNVLVYMVYSDRLIEGSPKNSTSSVPIMPWGSNDTIQKCADFISG